MAKEIIDAIKEAEIAGQESLEKAKAEAEKLVKDAKALAQDAAKAKIN